MTEFTAVLIILGLFALRFGLPVLATTVYSRTLRRVYARWQLPSDVRVP